MTNAQIINAMYAAFKEGLLTHETGDISVVRFGEIADQFNKWLESNYPELLKLYTPRDLYWHEFGCHASVHTPNRTGDCKCDGHMPGEKVELVIIEEPKPLTFRQRLDAAVKKYLPIILILLTLTACSQKHPKPEKNRYNTLYQLHEDGEPENCDRCSTYYVQIIDGCEYIAYGHALTHKGNCKNPAHH